MGAIKCLDISRVDVNPDDLYAEVTLMDKWDHPNIIKSLATFTTYIGPMEVLKNSEDPRDDLLQPPTFWRANSAPPRRTFVKKNSCKVKKSNTTNGPFFVPKENTFTRTVGGLSISVTPNSSTTHTTSTVSTTGSSTTSTRKMSLSKEESYRRRNSS